MTKRYEINPMPDSVIKKINKLKTILGIKKTGKLLEHVIDDYLKNNKAKLEKIMSEFFK